MSQFTATVDDSPYTAEELAALKAAHTCSPVEKLLSTVLLVSFWTTLVLVLTGIA